MWFVSYNTAVDQGVPGGLHGVDQELSTVVRFQRPAIADRYHGEAKTTGGCGPVLANAGRIGSFDGCWHVACFFLRRCSRRQAACGTCDK